MDEKICIPEFSLLTYKTHNFHTSETAWAVRLSPHGLGLAG